MKKTIYQRAIDTYGVTSQLGMMQEESIELALAIRKMNRNGSGEGLEDVIDEIADVIIMTRQMELVPGWKEKIDERVAFKLGRLNNRLNEFDCGEKRTNDVKKCNVQCDYCKECYQ